VVLFALIFVILFVPIVSAAWYDPLIAPFKALFSSSPEIISAYVDPSKVAPSDIMEVTAEIKDKYGVESVIADMSGIETIELQLDSGDQYNGIWKKNWYVHNVKQGVEYNTTIIATNIRIKQSSYIIGWVDDASYRFRRSITLNNNTGLIGVFINTMNLTGDGKLQGNCSDILFSTSKAFDTAFWSAEQNLSYTLEYGCNSTSTLFWVNASDVIEDPGTEPMIYVYYGLWSG